MATVNGQGNAQDGWIIQRVDDDGTEPPGAVLERVLDQHHPGWQDHLTRTDPYATAPVDLS